MHVQLVWHATHACTNSLTTQRNLIVVTSNHISACRPCFVLQINVHGALNIIWTRDTMPGDSNMSWSWWCHTGMYLWHSTVDFETQSSGNQFKHFNSSYHSQSLPSNTETFNFCKIFTNFTPAKASVACTAMRDTHATFPFTCEPCICPNQTNRISVNSPLIALSNGVQFVV